jgi:hypothetical protein
LKEKGRPEKGRPEKGRPEKGKLEKYCREIKKKINNFILAQWL